MLLFSKLPIELVKHIITFDKHFIIRNNEIISIIPKDDNRYTLLKNITLTFAHYRKFGFDRERYDYIFPNLYNDKERKEFFVEDDMIQVEMKHTDLNTIEYSIQISRLKRKENITMVKKPIFYKGNLSDCEWDYVFYNYTRN
jgi:hypothetical protein